MTLNNVDIAQFVVDADPGCGNSVNGDGLWSSCADQSGSPAG